jgi:hypothetical protein
LKFRLPIFGFDSFENRTEKTTNAPPAVLEEADVEPVTPWNAMRAWQLCGDTLVKPVLYRFVISLQ